MPIVIKRNQNNVVPIIRPTPAPEPAPPVVVEVKHVEASPPVVWDFGVTYDDRGRIANIRATPGAVDAPEPVADTQPG